MSDRPDLVRKPIDLTKMPGQCEMSGIYLNTKKLKRYLRKITDFSTGVNGRSC